MAMHETLYAEVDLTEAVVDLVKGGPSFGGVSAKLCKRDYCSIGTRSP